MNSNIKKCIIPAAAIIVSACNSTIADYNVIPAPSEIEWNNEAEGFRLNRNTVIAYTSAELKRDAELCADYIDELTGIRPTVTEGSSAAENVIVLSDGLDSENAEAYRINVGQQKIQIDGASPAGTFYGIQTLRKSIGAGAGRVTFPAAKIGDAPRFAYRGAHLDVARHFFPADSVKIFIDMLALHNVNRFHWHLTDDQGWRIEIKSRPELTTKGSVRKCTVIGANTDQYDSVPHGGFYTQEEIRDIVSYAADRHITVIPEIDMPGHMQAALTAYPELGCTGGPYELWCRWGISEDVLCAGNDESYRLVDDVLAEVVELFPSEYIHIGGDECPKVRWEKCPACQARIQALGLKDDAHSTAEQKLQTVFMTHASDVLKSRGRKVIGWDEMLEGGCPEGAVIMSWRGEAGGIQAAKMGHNAIMTPCEYCYFDFKQSDAPSEPQAAHWGVTLGVERVYNYEPVPESFTDEQKARILGVQANLWAEYVPTMRHAQYMELPRLAAMSEVQWCASGKKDYEDFLTRVPRLAAIYELYGYNYARHIFE